MNIKELKSKFSNSVPDRILGRNLELLVKISYVPEKQLYGESIILEDETGKLEATAKENLVGFLKEQFKRGSKVKIKGYLTKTEFENLSFGIEQIIE